jgi:hypothetical protein
LTAAIAESVIHATRGDDALPAVATLIGGRPQTSSSEKLQFTDEIILKLVPHFTLFRNDEPMDRNSPVVSQINQALRQRDSALLNKVFKNNHPVNARWLFTATNLSTGKSLPVYTSSTNAGDGVLIEYTGAKNDSFRVKFLPGSSGGIIELSAKAFVTDAFGNRQQVEQKIWSHRFSTGADIRETAKLVEDLSGLRDSKLLLPPPADEKTNSILLSEKMRHVYILNAYLKTMRRDKQITVDELKRMISAIKKFGFM